MNLHVTAVASSSEGLLACGYHTVRCIVGSGGVSLEQNAKATPAGTFELKTIYYRLGKIEAPVSGLPVEPLTADADWPDAPGYDLIVSIDDRDQHSHQLHGRHIALRIAEDGEQSTDGSIAIARADLVRIVRNLNPGSKITIGNEPQSFRI